VLSLNVTRRPVSTRNRGNHTKARGLAHSVLSSLQKFVPAIFTKSNAGETKMRRRRPNAKRTSTAESQAVGTKALDPRYAAALARGAILRKKIAAAEGGSISPAKAAQVLGISETAVLKRWRDHRLVGWSDGKSIHFPVWQFSGNKLRPGIVETLQIFRSDEQWRVLMYFLANRESLNGERPLDLLRRGEASKVIEHAASYAQDGIW
jgi:hypothetical protein